MNAFPILFDHLMLCFANVYSSITETLRHFLSLQYQSDFSKIVLQSQKIICKNNKLTIMRIFQNYEKKLPKSKEISEA